jgi:DNA primase
MATTPVEQIKERLHVEDVVGSYVKLEKSGKNLKAKCPFHNEKTPSFYVSPDRGSYYCFGCGAKGDIFSFVEQFEGLDFMGALKLLADKAGVELPKRGQGLGAAEYAKEKSEKERLHAVMEEATLFFESERGRSGVEAAKAREYIEKRGLSPETVKEFRIGFVPNDWRLLYSHLKSKGYGDVDIEKAGLAKRPDAGEQPAEGTQPSSVQLKTPYDRFRGRVMFPIMDSSGRVIAFSGRILEDDGKSAKYLNSPDTPLFNKSTVLYGLDKAKHAIREKDYSILVEGQMDLVLSHQAGIKNTVAVSGTALADETVSRDGVINNLGVVRRLSSNIILAFDSDSAGRKAAMRSAQIALSLGMDVKIADLPEGKDPADMVLVDPESWKNTLRNAKPVIEFLIDHIAIDLAAKKLAERKVPEAVRERVLPFIATMSGKMDQARYVKMIRERLLQSEREESIWEDLNKVVATIAQTKPTVSNSGQSTVGRGTMHSTAQASRLDVISRKLFGLLAYFDREKSFDTSGPYAAIKDIAGLERYNNLISTIEPVKNELILEAEIFFGTGSDPVKIKKDIDELLLNFEEDIVREDFAKAMNELSRLEKISEIKQAEELMKKCQALSLRIAELAKKKK